MNWRNGSVGMLIVAALALAAAPVTAGEVRSRMSVQLGGAVGKLMNRMVDQDFETVRRTEGDQQISLGGPSGQYIHLGQERMCDLRIKKKTFSCSTFQEFRDQMAQVSEVFSGFGGGAPGQAASDGDAPELTTRVDVQSRDVEENINGFDTRLVEVVITVFQGDTLVAEMKNSLYIGPRLAAVEEEAQFGRRMAEKLGLQLAGVQQLAQVVAGSHAIQQAIKEFEAHRSELDGTPIRVISTLETIQVGGGGAEGGGAGSALRGLRSRLRRKRGGDAGGEPQRRLVYTSSHEILSASDELSGPITIQTPPYREVEN